MSHQLNKSAGSSGQLEAERLKTLMQGYESSYPNHLAEQFPRIVNNIVSLWHSPEAMTSYLDKLLITDRPNRQGFPRAVASELFALSRIYEEVHSLRSKRDNTWGFFS